MPRMKNVHVYVDVDLTLVDHRGVLLPNVAEAMRVLYDGGCHLFLWSTGGADYCRQVAERAGVADLFEAFLPKPDLYVDDMPSTIFNSPLFNVQDEKDWLPLAEKIVRDHVDPGERRPPSTEVDPLPMATPVVVNYVFPARPEAEPPDPDVLKPLADGFARAVQFSLVGMGVGGLFIVSAMAGPFAMLLVIGLWLSAVTILATRRGRRGMALGLFIGGPLGIIVAMCVVMLASGR